MYAEGKSEREESENALLFHFFRLISFFSAHCNFDDDTFCDSLAICEKMEPRLEIENPFLRSVRCVSLFSPDYNEKELRSMQIEGVTKSPPQKKTTLLSF